MIKLKSEKRDFGDGMKEHKVHISNKALVNYMWRLLQIMGVGFVWYALWGFGIITSFWALVLIIGSVVNFGNATPVKTYVSKGGKSND